MSVSVPLERLHDAVGERPPFAYILTVSDDGRPHAVHVAIAWEGDCLVARVGSRSAANASARPAVSLVLPVRTDGDHTLIVDGTASVTETSGERRVAIAPTKAVLHRRTAAPRPDAPCPDDCVPLLGDRSFTAGSP